MIRWGCGWSPHLSSTMVQRTLQSFTLTASSVVLICSQFMVWRSSQDTEHVTFHNSLNLYRGFYINHFIDHHTFKLVS
ncbi:hypothetical protein PAXRUDRAFT_790748, partial [Paxillus rubicundulus Ve08.2h10]